MSGLTDVNADELAAFEVFAGCSADDLVPLAAQLKPLTAAPGEVLTRQGQRAVSFLLVGSGATEVVHTGSDDVSTVVQLSKGLIIGEIALLRDAPRTATVMATTPLSGWVGGREAFSSMLEIPGMADKLVRIARQRLAQFVVPILVQLRDGTELFLRPGLPGDKKSVLDGAVEFSSETLYRRFQSMPTKSLLRYLFEVDYVDHFVWVLTDGADGPGVADARFVRDHEDPHLAEVAFTVGDAYQLRGIGTFLMEALSIAARSDGVERFYARVLSENYPMRKIMDRFGANWEIPEPGVVTTTIEVPQLSDLTVTPELSQHIRDVARNVIRATGG